jgi:hypothetical protein
MSNLHSIELSSIRLFEDMSGETLASSKVEIEFKSLTDPTRAGAQMTFRIAVPATPSSTIQNIEHDILTRAAELLQSAAAVSPAQLTALQQQTRKDAAQYRG